MGPKKIHPRLVWPVGGSPMYTVPLSESFHTCTQLNPLNPHMSEGWQT